MLTNTKTKTIAIAILCLSIASFGAEPVSISHSITSCTVDGPTATLNLTLEIVNNTTTVLSGVKITTASMGPLEKRLGLIFKQAAMQVGDIPAEGVISVDYTIESAYALSEDEIGHTPVFWEVGYIDETDQQQMIVVPSEAPFSEPQVTTETASPAVASLSGSGVISEWVARYNGPANSSDRAYAMALDPEGNIYVTGSSLGSGVPSFDYATIKYDSSGNQLWVARYNGPGNVQDYAYAIAVDASANVYVTGKSDSISGINDYDYATIKYDSSGNELWVARYDGPGNGYDEARAIAVDASGNVYVTGWSWRSGAGFSYDYATVKYDSSGNELWVARYDGPGNHWDFAHAMTLDGSGNVYVTGRSYDTDTNVDYATVKYDSSGNQLWVARYNCPGNGFGCDEAYAIAVDASGNVYVTGSSDGSGGTYYDYDYATVKYDANGNELWVARYDGPAKGNDWARAMAVDALGNVYVTGQSRGSTHYDYATVKYDSSGNQLWVARYNGPANSGGCAWAMALGPEGNVYVTGFSAGDGTSSDYASVKYDSSGNELWVARYNGPANIYDYAYAMALDASGNVYVTGGSYGSGTHYDYATIKYSQCADPIELLLGLAQDVIELNLQNGIENSLDAKLSAALGALQDVNENNNGAAINTLQAFINAVEAQRGDKIPNEADANALIDLANEIIVGLQNGCY
jgi:uncharacterized delta-60 repeat protein